MGKVEQLGGLYNDFLGQGLNVGPYFQTLWVLTTNFFQDHGDDMSWGVFTFRLQRPCKIITRFINAICIINLNQKRKNKTAHENPKSLQECFFK